MFSFSPIVIMTCKQQLASSCAYALHRLLVSMHSKALTLSSSMERFFGSSKKKKHYFQEFSESKANVSVLFLIRFNLPAIKNNWSYIERCCFGRKKRQINNWMRISLQSIRLNLQSRLISWYATGSHLWWDCKLSNDIWRLFIKMIFSINEKNQWFWKKDRICFWLLNLFMSKSRSSTAVSNCAWTRFTIKIQLQKSFPIVEGLYECFILSIW